MPGWRFSCVFSSPARRAGSAPPSFPKLIGAGHQVTGLARSEASAAALAAAGADVQRGTLDDLDILRRAAAASDGVIHLAFKHESAFSGDFQGAADADRRAVEAFGEALAGSDRPLVIASGTLGLAPGRVATEQDGHDTAGRGGHGQRSRGPARHCRVHHRAGRPPGALVCVAAPAELPRGRGQRLHGDAGRHRQENGAAPATQATGRVAGPPCTGSTPRTCSGWRWSGPRQDRHCRPSRTRACPCATSPRSSAGTLTCRSPPSPPTRPARASGSWRRCSLSTARHPPL